MITQTYLTKLRESRQRKLLKEMERVKRRLVSMGAQKVVLFGSAARGEIGLFSDIDMLVVMDSPLPFIERLMEIYGKIRPSAVDMFVYTPQEFDEIKETNPLVRHALKEGKVIYEKVS